jgi:Protein of unknown function (DUF2934)
VIIWVTSLLKKTPFPADVWGWEMSMPNTTLAEEIIDETAIHEAVEKRARELWELSGRRDGHADEDWKQAEREIRSRVATPGQHGNRRIIVKVGEVTYTGEYDPATAGSYHPGDLQPGAEIRIQFQDDCMLLKLADGRQLQAKIIRTEKAAAQV